MIGLKNTGSVVAIAVLYGYFAGMCRFQSSLEFYMAEALHQVIALTAPFLATLADDLSELG